MQLSTLSWSRDNWGAGLQLLYSFDAFPFALHYQSSRPVLRCGCLTYRVLGVPLPWQPDVMYTLPSTINHQAVAFGTSTRNDWEATRINKKDTYNPNGEL